MKCLDDQQPQPGVVARVYAFDSVGSFVTRPIGLALTGPTTAAVGLHR